MDLRENIEQVIEKDIRPILLEHQGDIEIKSLEDNKLIVRLLGQCTRCAAAAMTFEDLVKNTLMTQIRELDDVILDDSVPQDMMDLAKKLLRHEM